MERKRNIEERDIKMKKKINMLSKADMVKGQGVLSAHDEQVALVKQVMKQQAVILENTKKSCDIVHYHSINPEYYFSIPVKRKQSALVGSVHFLPETVENSISLPRTIKNTFYKYMISFYKKMDYLVTVNPIFIDKLVDYGIPREKITYIPNVVSEEHFYPLSKEKRNQIRKKCKIGKDTFTVLCVGQLQKRKGVLNFIEIARRMPDYQFVWAGGFSFGKISEGYEEIREAMKHAPKNIKFLGIIDREKMNEVYNMADVMFLPSYEELFPMTILESMNCALPVLVRDLSIYDPILFDYALRGRETSDFVRILTQLKEEPDFYQRSAHASYEGHLRYSTESVGEEWKKFYCRILQEQEVKKEVLLWKKQKQQYV